MENWNVVRDGDRLSIAEGIRRLAVLLPYSDREETARLMAAAPKLVEALKNARRCLADIDSAVKDIESR
jgi:hypothetical protein